MPPGSTIAVVIDAAAAQQACSAGRHAWWRYAAEVLDHVRLAHRVLPAPPAGPPPADVAVLIFTTAPRLDPRARADLDAWVRAGGVVLVVADPAELGELAGVAARAPVDHGHVRVAGSPVWSSVPDVAVHAVGGVRLTASAGTRPAVEVLARWEPDAAGPAEPAITLRRHGAGAVLACGVDLWQSIVRIQQGYPVTADGKPAADGTAPIDEGILKCEDGMALSFEQDRAMPPGEPELTAPFEHTYPPPTAAPIFHRPHADLWRSLLLQSVWWAAEHTGVALPWLGYWPAGVPAVAHLSHDADVNDDADARAALDTFAEAGVRVTWCQVFPGGYSPKTYAAIAAAGHEHALHYNAMGDADLAEWGWPQLRAQHAWAQAVTGREHIVSNKNHYTRWEGWAEFYQWCERLGIQLDESRGPSKQGNLGFPFGTAHVSFPMADPGQGGRLLDVLALPLHTQDLAWAGHESCRDVILDAVLDQHGVAHFLFHGPHLRGRPATRRACLALAAEVRRRGMPWWTSEEINRWERRRRGVTLAAGRHGDTLVVEATAAEAVPNASVLLAVPGVGPGSRPTAPGAATGVLRRHGRYFVELVVNIEAGDNRWVLSV